MHQSMMLSEDREKFLQAARESFLSHALYDAILDLDLWNVLHLLRERKANPNCILDAYGVAPIHCATGIGDEKCGYQMTALCLDHGGDPNVRLMYCTDCSKFSLLPYNLGCWGGRCSDGMTPVMIAALWDRPRVLLLLIEKGGDICLTDSDGKTSFDFAQERQSLATFSILIANLSSRLSSTLDSRLSSSSDSLKTCLSEFSTKADPGLRKFNEDFSDIDSEFSYFEVFYPDKAILKRSLSEPCLASSTSVSERDSDSGTLDHSTVSLDVCDYKNTSFGSLSSCPTDNLKERLKFHGIILGPIVKTTKRVYLYQLKKIKNGCHHFLTDTKSGVNDVLSSTLGGRLEEKVMKWSYLEREVSLYFNDLARGMDKKFYTYMLLDPFVTKDLPSRAPQMTLTEQWTTFIESIFYVGKGKNARVSQHLVEAIKYKPEFATKKLKKIHEIFDKNGGVICFQVFLHTSTLEAHTREAAMIDALSGCHLTNEQGGRYYGLMDKWPLKQKRQLGVFLLYKSLQSFLIGSERQIFQKDVKV